MSYIAFDLDALKAVPDAARAAGIGEAELGYGLVRLWQWCWTKKADTVKTAHLLGFFGGCEPVRLGAALEAFGFTEVAEDGLRVKGAERYLRVSEGRSKGGKAAAGNLKRGTTPSRLVPGLSPAEAPASPRLTPGLSPTTEHRLPTTDTKKLAPAQKPAAPPNARRALQDALCAAFTSERDGERYAWQGAKDTDALKRIEGKAEGDTEKILGRWRRGLTSAGWLRVNTVAQLDGKWNDLADTGPPAKDQQPSFTGTGPMRAEVGTL